MTTREEYAEAAEFAERAGRFYQEWEKGELAARVLRALADGAQLVMPEGKNEPD